MRWEGREEELPVVEIVFSGCWGVVDCGSANAGADFRPNTRARMELGDIERGGVYGCLATSVTAETGRRDGAVVGIDGRGG
jgi:hypothetical protein